MSWLHEVGTGDFNGVSWLHDIGTGDFNEVSEVVT